MAVTGVLGGQTDMQVVANTLAPYVAHGIGQQFRHGEDKNKAARPEIGYTHMYTFAIAFYLTQSCLGEITPNFRRIYLSVQDKKLKFTFFWRKKI